MGKKGNKNRSATRRMGSGDSTPRDMSPAASSDTYDEDDRPFYEGDYNMEVEVDEDVESVEDEEDVGEDYDAILSELINTLGERNSRETRVSTLNLLKEVLQKHFCEEEMSSRTMTVVELIRKIVNKGGNKEKELGYRILALVTITGAQSDVILTVRDDIMVILEQGSFDRTIPDDVRAVAISALALVSFLLLDGHELASIAEPKFASHIRSHDPAHGPKTTAALLRAVALLSSDISDRAMIETLFKNVFKHSLKWIEHSDVDLCSAAVSALAVMFEVRIESGESLSEYAGTILKEISGILGGTQKHRSKKDRYTHRVMLRELAGYLETGEIGDVKYQLKQTQLRLDSFAQFTQMGSFKFFLESYLLVHLIDNELLAEVFQIDFRMVNPLFAQLSRKMKRAIKSPSSKVAKDRTTTRNRLRRDKRMKNKGFEDDLDDDGF